jgi:hypothetical protein
MLAVGAQVPGGAVRGGGVGGFLVGAAEATHTGTASAARVTSENATVPRLLIREGG